MLKVLINVHTLGANMNINSTNYFKNLGKKTCILTYRNLHISHKTTHTHIHRAGSLFVAKTGLTCQTMDLTRGLKVCCGIWHQDASSRSFTTCQPPCFGLRGSDMLVQQHPSDACFDRDLGNLEAESTPPTYCYHHELSHCRNICVSPTATRNKWGPNIKEGWMIKVQTLYWTDGDRPTLAAH